MPDYEVLIGYATRIPGCLILAHVDKQEMSEMLFYWEQSWVFSRAMALHHQQMKRNI